MLKVSILFVVLALVWVEGRSKSNVCDNGHKILSIGLGDGQKKVIVNEHNRYRLMIAHGELHGQPEGTDLLKMSYDDPLGNKARKVSQQCVMEHLEVADPRWYHVGQNLYIEYSTEKSSRQNWDKAIAAWFGEHEEYTFGQGFSMNTGHYTQVVWAETDNVGCDFIQFEVVGHRFPYQSLYVCNYGPGGNVMGQDPYSTSGPNKCKNLC